jgi:hypothetical protein
MHPSCSLWVQRKATAVRMFLGFFRFGVLAFELSEGMGPGLNKDSPGGHSDVAESCFRYSRARQSRL